MLPMPRSAGLQGQPCTSRVCDMTCQWDETQQKLAPILKGLPANTRRSRLQQAAQTMVISGAVYTITTEVSDGETTRQIATEPCRQKPTRLELATTDFLLEVVLRSLPIDLLSHASVERVAYSCDFLVLTATVDRASPNLCSGAWVRGRIESKCKVDNMLFHPEFCALHAIATVKNRARGLREIASGLYSFTRWMRIGRNQYAFVAALKKRIEGQLVLVDSQRPAGGRANAIELLELIYGDFTADFLWHRSSKTGELMMSTLLQDMLIICIALDFNGTSTQLRVYNRVSEDSVEHAEHGLPVDSIIWEDRDIAVNALCAIFINFLAQRGWAAATLSRWVMTFEAVESLGFQQIFELRKICRVKS